MSKLDELNLNLFNVLNAFTHSQNLCKLLFYDSLTPLSESDIAKPSTLMYTKIYPIPKVPDTATEAGSILTVFYDDIQLGRQNTGFKNSVVCVHVLCHIDKWKITGAIRPYSIMAEVDKVLNEQRIAGLGRMQFERSRFMAINSFYSGFSMYYNIVDFN